MDRTEYFNQMLVRLEELLFHELSGCAAWKVEMVGTDFIQSKKIEGNTVDDVVKGCIREITSSGLVKGMDYKVGGKGILLKLSMKDCVHLPKEVRLKQSGIKPYLCPISNMVLDQVIEKLHFETTYLARLDIDEARGICTVQCAIYETADKIGEVSDWSKE